MAEKEQVVVEIVRDENPLAPAPPATSTSADLDLILNAIKKEKKTAAPETKAVASAKKATITTARPPAPVNHVVNFAIAEEPTEVAVKKPEPTATVEKPEATASMELTASTATEKSASPLVPPGEPAPKVPEVVPNLDPTMIAADGLLDLGFEEEHTEADASPAIGKEFIQSEAPPAIEEEATLNDAAAVLGARLKLSEASAAPIPVREAPENPAASAAEPVPVRAAQEDPAASAAEPVPVRAKEEDPAASAAEPVPVRAKAEDVNEVAAGVAPVAAKSSEYSGAGMVVEVESEAQREAREIQEARIYAREHAEEIAKAELIAKAEAEAEVIKAVRAEMEAKKKKREEARAAKRMAADSGQSTGPAKNVQERIRGLSVVEQQKLARTGDQRERVALERLYGKIVWESLLRNPKLTPPEVSRIARMGSLPLPMIEIIVSNRSWLSAPQVRRALFTNPRLKKDMLMTVLRATPKAELKLMPKQMSYPAQVRQAAKRLIR